METFTGFKIIQRACDARDSGHQLHRLPLPNGLLGLLPPKLGSRNMAVTSKGLRRSAAGLVSDFREGTVLEQFKAI